MPVDNYRINKPEISETYDLYDNKLSSIANANKSYNQLLYEKIRGHGNVERNDGRKANELRKIYMKTGVVTEAKGSAYIEQNRTKVIVSIFDPREIPNKNDYSLNGVLYCEFKYAPFSCRKRRSHQQDSEEKEFSVIMRRALESAVCRQEFPNFQLDIYALVLENDGSALSAAITCAGLAMAHAGVPMFDLLSSVTLGLQGDEDDGTLFLDPTYEEELLCSTLENNHNHAHGIIVLCILSTHQQVSELYQTGCLSFQTLTKCIQLLTDMNKEIVPLVEKCLVKNVHKYIIEKKKVVNDDE